MKDLYSPLKVFHHQERLAAIRHGEIPGPIHCQLILTNRCNQSCRTCAYRTKGYSSAEAFNDKDEIPFEKVLEIIQDCKLLGVQAIELTGGGEPTIHPNFAEICYAIDKAGIDFAVVTNGSRLDAEQIKAMAAAKWVRFSLDAAQDTTYAATRHAVHGTLHAVRENIRLLGDMPSQTVIGVGFVVTKDNWEEVYQAAVQAKKDGADNFRISAVFQNEGSDYFSNFYAHAARLCNDAKRDLENGNFTVFNLFGERLDDLAQQSPNDPYCPLQQLVTYIGADQNVYRCCVVAYNQLGLLGSIKDRRFYDLWRSFATAEKFHEFDARRCPRCMANRKNATIRYALANDPPHVNFL